MTTEVPKRRRATSRGNAAEDAYERLARAQQAVAELQQVPVAEASLPALVDTQPPALAVEASEPGPDVAPISETVITGTVLLPSTGIDEPEFEMAPEGDQEAQFVHYDALISRARSKVEKTLTKAERYWRLTAGPALKEIRDKGLYKANYATFEQYVSQRWQMSRPRAYQLIDSVRAMEWLEGVTSEVPNERQLRAILPIGDTCGEKAAQEVWQLAESRGRTSGSALEAAARELGYRPAIEAPKDAPAPQPVWARYEPVLGMLEDLGGLRLVAREAPERAKRLAEKFRKAAEELEADLSGDDERE
jgi:hypothetical protein